METVVEQSNSTEATGRLRCQRCGVESFEPSCFIVPEQYGKPPRDTRCITCEQARTQVGLSRTLFMNAIYVTLIVCVVLRYDMRSSPELLLGSLIIGALLNGAVTLIHELGHALTALAVGLEVGAIRIGSGPTLWIGEILRTPVHWYAWPFWGITYMGAKTTRGFRWKLATATFMGAGTNILAAAVTLPFLSVIPNGLPMLTAVIWIVLNISTALINLYPSAFSMAGQHFVTDGRLILNIKSYGNGEAHLGVKPLMRAMTCYDLKQYSQAVQLAKEGLLKNPRDPSLHLTLGAAFIGLRDYSGALGVYRSMLDPGVSRTPSELAAAKNNVAYCLAILSAPGLGASAEEACDHLAEADRLSSEAHSAFPCTLSFIGTRALILAKLNRADEALRLLEYSHYPGGTPLQRGHRAMAQAVAFNVLGRAAESRDAAAESAQIDPDNKDLLGIFGLATRAA